MGKNYKEEKEEAEKGEIRNRQRRGKDSKELYKEEGEERKMNR